MSVSWTTRLPSPFWILVALLATATFAMALLGNPAAAVVPTVAVAFLYLLVKLPPQVPALSFIFIGLITDNPSDYGPWETPLFQLGLYLFAQLKKSIPIDALVMTGADTLILLLVALTLWKRATGRTRDDQRVTPPLAFQIAWMSGLIIVLVAWGWGLSRGGEFRWSQWQLVQMLHFPMMVGAFSALIPNPKSGDLLMTLILIAAIIKCGFAFIAYSIDPEADFMTSHQDSILFATAFCFLCLRVLEQPGKRSAILAVTIMPLLIAAMVVNDRRLVWVQIILALGFVFYATRWSLIKFRLARLALLAIPVVALYLGAGWSSSGTGVFAPVATVRSVVDSKSDGSTKWRDLENFNLYVTLSQNRLLGTGLGHPFVEAVSLPDVTSVYELEPYMPHNSVLGLWAYTGYVGFSIWWMLMVVTAFIALRGYHFAREPSTRIRAMTVAAGIIIYMLQAYGDIGLAAWSALLALAPLFVVVAKQAVVDGAFVEPAGARPAVRRQRPRRFIG